MPRWKVDLDVRCRAEVYVDADDEAEACEIAGGYDETELDDLRVVDSEANGATLVAG